MGKGLMEHMGFGVYIEISGNKASMDISRIFQEEK